MFKMFARSGLGAAILLALSAAKASAETFCVLGLCITIGGGGGDTSHAPEFDPAQGFAAVAVLICVALVLREKFLRARQSA